ncbi:uncharacterized protein MELLADRAFT_104063 [Melampsora larici-populina 98AG31]|uniref:Uncharacterized protein n=1 Tax=Melampsora larici-populina (strain 98AG31 / pathotype 3-4-7) TaxID=747676 RepID=F4RDF5_MELLP|nr:uncharacterized protein MELLADRAFT_104063 [Melampsora larici-populina 98AG31]EGG09392.1 hypothetical protein MELLADRAFT_104063 [Melampsora larici-populina 98AG31]
MTRCIEFPGRKYDSERARCKDETITYNRYWSPQFGVDLFRNPYLLAGSGKQVAKQVFAWSDELARCDSWIIKSAVGRFLKRVAPSNTVHREGWSLPYRKRALGANWRSTKCWA